MATHQLSRFTLNHSVVVEGQEFAVRLQTMTKSLFFTPREDDVSCLQNGTQQIEPHILEMLYDKGFLVQEGTDETSVLEVWLQQYRYDSSTIVARIHPSEVCNLACTYCCRESPGATTMSAEEIAGAVRFLCKETAEKHASKLFVNFSGGEIFLFPQLFKDAAGALFAYASKKDLLFQFSATSNGTLLHAPTIRELQKVGLTGLNVSLGVSQESHDKLRPGRNGEATYRKILDNLSALSDLQIPVTVLCQYDSTTNDYREVGSLLNDLARSGAPVKTVMFSPIIPMHCDATDSALWAGIVDPEVFLYLIHEADKKGLSQFSSDEPPGGNCAATMSSQYTITAKGKLVSCPAKLDDMAIGDIHKGVDFVRQAPLLNRKLPERCLSCSIAPLCGGGVCQWQSDISKGRFGSGSECRYESLRRIIEAYMEEKARKAILSSKISEEWYPAA